MTKFKFDVNSCLEKAKIEKFETVESHDVDDLIPVLILPWSWWGVPSSIRNVQGRYTFALRLLLNNFSYLSRRDRSPQRPAQLVRDRPIRSCVFFGLICSPNAPGSAVKVGPPTNTTTPSASGKFSCKTHDLEAAQCFKMSQNFWAKNL